jgi:uncharacterized protein YutE (UPF0331/DUF86 family)
LSERLIDSRGMRNFIVHKYGEIDDSKVFYALKEEFITDVREFMDNIKKSI